MTLQKVLKISLILQFVLVIAILLGEFVKIDHLHPSLQTYVLWEERQVLQDSYFIFSNFNIEIMILMLLAILSYFISIIGLLFMNSWAKQVFVFSVVLMFLFNFIGLYQLYSLHY